jgi:hypothetical protein
VATDLHDRRRDISCKGRRREEVHVTWAGREGGCKGGGAREAAREGLQGGGDLLGRSAASAMGGFETRESMGDG